MNETKDSELVLGVYPRKSEEDKKRQILSLDDQIREMKDVQRREGLNVKIWYPGESRSAHKRGRPIFGDMIQDIEDGKINALLVWHANRLARNAYDAGTLITLMDEGKLLAIKTPSRTYYNTGADKAWLGSQFVDAKKYSDESGENVRRTLHGKRLDGWMPCTAPLGYLNTKSSIRGSNTIIKDPERFDVLRKAWDLMLTGNYSVDQILYKLNSEWGMRTRQWAERGGKPISRSGLYNVFTNPFYMKVIPYQKGGKRLGKNNPVELLPGKHDEMVSPDEFAKVQVILGREGKARPHRNEYAYNGLITCGECGGFISATHKKKILRSTGELKTYTLYYCVNARKNPDSCSQSFYTRVEIVEEEIERLLADVAITPEVKDWTLQAIAEQGMEIEHTNKTITKTKDELIARAQKQLDNLMHLRLQGLIDDEDFQRKHTELKNEITLTKAQRDSQIESADDWLDLTVQAFEFAAYAHKAFQKGDASVRRELLSAIGLNRRLLNGAFSFEAVEWLIPIAERPNALSTETGAFEPEPTRTSATKSRYDEFRPLVRSGRDLNPQPPA